MKEAAGGPPDLWRWDVRTERPRIYLDVERLAFVRAKVAGKTSAEVNALAGTGVEGLALAYVLTGEEASGRAAIEQALAGATGFNANAATPLAIAYDWCGPVWTPEERTKAREWMAAFIRHEMGRGSLWSSFHNFHYSVGQAVGFAAIAMYGEDPVAAEALDFLNAEYHDALKVFEMLFPDGEWPESFDYNRVSTYRALRFLWAIKTACGVDLMRDSVHMRNTSLYIIYGSKPNGLVCTDDDVDWPYLSDLDREALLFCVAEWRDPYAQYYLNRCNAPYFQPNDKTRWRDLLWADDTVPEKPVDTLPLSRLFRGEGMVMARSGWGWDEPGHRDGTTWVTFRCGRYYAGHSHYDNGHFDIYYKGELALDSGRYDDDWGLQSDPQTVVTSEFFNYYKRSIAHNTILVYDPDEKMDMGVVNDGGQMDLLMKGGRRNTPSDYDQGNYPPPDGTGEWDWAKNPGRWDVGEMLAYKATGLFTYACGDATKSYNPAKMRAFVRQFLFIQPNVVIVFDRLVSTNPDFKKTWLLHSVTEPTISADGTMEIVNGDGRLVCVPVHACEAEHHQGRWARGRVSRRRHPLRGRAQRIERPQGRPPLRRNPRRLAHRGMPLGSRRGGLLPQRHARHGQGV